MTAPVDDLIQNAIKARQRSQTALVNAVREARAAGWSFARISAGLGGSPSPEALSRAFPDESGGCGAGCACCG